MEHADPSKLTYADSGIHMEAAAEAKRRIQIHARGTFTAGVLTDIGSFGALFKFDKDRYVEPLLVSSCDGVGTKLKIATMTGIHHTVGYDLVSHCVSDILVQGARPLFFLDYIACGNMDPGIVERIIAGLARGCKEAGCALIGGETAEMPDFYAPGEYDLAGFIVGVVDRDKVVDGSRIRPGDWLFGLASVGLHTNGYSMARKLFFDRLSYRPDDHIPELGSSIADLLLTPHRSYLRLIEPLLDSGVLKGMAHITGGGITDNLPRILPVGTAATIRRGSWPVLPIFDYIQEKGSVDDSEMFHTFNMGIGMILAVSPTDIETVRAHFHAIDEPCYEIGEIIAGEGHVQYIP